PPTKPREELSNESAKSESRRPRRSTRWRRPAEPKPATRPADAETRTGRTARWSRWRARWWTENLVSSFGRFSSLSPASAGLFLMKVRRDSPGATSGPAAVVGGWRVLHRPHLTIP